MSEAIEAFILPCDPVNNNKECWNKNEKWNASDVGSVSMVEGRDQDTKLDLRFMIINNTKL